MLKNSHTEALHLNKAQCSSHAVVNLADIICLQMVIRKQVQQ